LGETLGTESKSLWSAPIVKTVPALTTFEHLIPAFVRQHVEDIRAGRKDYAGYSRDVHDVANSRWNWQVALSAVLHQGNQNSVNMRCRGGFFEEEYVELGKPCLWVFDCRRGGSEGEDEVWSEDDYGKAL